MPAASKPAPENMPQANTPPNIPGDTRPPKRASNSRNLNSDQPGYRCYAPQTKPDVPFKGHLAELHAFFRQGGAYRQIVERDIAWPFMEPVNEALAMVPDYYDVIKTPMDFSTLRKRHTNRWYSSLQQFLDDYRLIFSNCYRYNPPKTDVHGMARELELFAQPFIAPIERKIALEQKQAKSTTAEQPVAVTHTSQSSEKPLLNGTTAENKKAAPVNEQKTASPANAAKPVRKAERRKSVEKANNKKESTVNNTTAKEKNVSTAKQSAASTPKTSKKDSQQTTPGATTEPTNHKRDAPALSPIAPSKPTASKKPFKNTSAAAESSKLEKIEPGADHAPANSTTVTTAEQETPHEKDVENFLKHIDESSSNLKQTLFDPHVLVSQRIVPSLSPKVMSDCHAILTQLKDEKYRHVLWPFLKHPPNVKFPDLTFVELSLNAGKYVTVEEFATAVRHVFMHILTSYDENSEINNMANQSLNIFHHIYGEYLNRNLNLIKHRTRDLSSMDEKVEQVFQLLMKDCDIQKTLGINDRKLLQQEKRISEVERQFSAFRHQSTQTIDKLRKRISYLKSKQQSDLVYINEKFQTAVKSAALYAGSGSFTGQVVPQSTPLQTKNVKSKFDRYYQNKTIAPLKEMDMLEQTSRSILLSGTSKSDDEEEALRSLSPEEKRKLTHDINRLSQKMLSQLIDQIILAEGVEKSALAPNEFIIDYDVMKPETLRKVAQFVSNCVKRLPRQKQIQGIPITDPNYHPNATGGVTIKTEPALTPTNSANSNNNNHHMDNNDNNMLRQNDNLSASSEGEQLQIEESELNKLQQQPSSISSQAANNNEILPLASSAENQQQTKKNLLDIKKSKDTNQLVHALQSLEKDKSSNSEANQQQQQRSLTPNAKQNAFVHLIPGHSNNPDVAMSLKHDVWSNFGENLKENINSAAEAKALESVVGNDYSFNEVEKKKKSAMLQQAENNPADTQQPSEAQSQPGGAAGSQGGNLSSASPNDAATHAGSQGPSQQQISSPASNSSQGANSHSTASKEQLKAEAKKRRAAKIDKNETLEQREMMTTFEEGAMM